MKPHFRVIDGQHIPVRGNESPLERARRRFGRKFAHEPGTDYERKAEPVLTRWLKGAEWKNRRSE